MITSMHVKNFKCFKDLEVKDLGRFNLIGGQNNVGKTSLLEAVYLFVSCPQTRLIDLLVLRAPLPALQGVQGSFKSLDLLKPFFYDFRTEEKIEIASNHYAEQLEVSLTHKFELAEISKMNNANFMASLGGELPLKVSHVYSSQKKELFTALDFFSTQQRQGLPVASHTKPIPKTVYLKMTGEPQFLRDTKLFEDLSRQKKEEELLEAIRILEPKVKKIDILNGILYLDLGLPEKMPIYLTGDGLMHWISLAIAIFSCKDGVLLVDEIETGLYHGKLNEIFAALARLAEMMSCQIFVSTHSYECIKAAYEGFKAQPEALRYLRLNHLDEDIISTTYSRDGFARSIDHEWELR